MIEKDKNLYYTEDERKTKTYTHPDEKKKKNNIFIPWVIVLWVHCSILFRQIEGKQIMNVDIVNVYGRPYVRDKEPSYNKCIL